MIPTFFIVIYVVFAIIIVISIIINVKKQHFSHSTYKKNREKREKEKQIFTDDYKGKEFVINPNVAEIKELNKKCPSCHLEIIPGRDKHCPHCGASLTNICPHCHLINHENAFLCQECYTKLPYATKKNKNKKKDEDDPLEF